jgi:hypothetical protein
MSHRPIHTIARDIRRDWQRVNYAAQPYLNAMARLDAPSDKYGLDDARSIMRYFLSNASSWRGDTARAIKAEIKAMI